MDSGQDCPKTNRRDFNRLGTAIEFLSTCPPRRWTSGQGGQTSGQDGGQGEIRALNAQALGPRIRGATRAYAHARELYGLLRNQPEVRLRRGGELRAA